MEGKKSFKTVSFFVYVMSKKKISKDVFLELISLITQKPVLKNLDKQYVGLLAADFLLKYPLLVEKLSNTQSLEEMQKDKDLKTFLKDIRAELNIRYGMFKTQKSKRVPVLLEKLKKEVETNGLSKESIGLHRKLLATHKSSMERLSFYPDLYEKLFAITGKPDSILDIACGLNPLSFVYMGFDSKDNHNVQYYAAELSPVDCTELQFYFSFMKKQGLHGNTASCNLLLPDSCQKLTNQFPSD